MKDGLHVYDNPVGVLTNNPPFPSQMFALNNYAGVSRKQPRVLLQEYYSLMHIERNGWNGNTWRSFQPVKICESCLYKIKFDLR